MTGRVMWVQYIYDDDKRSAAGLGQSLHRAEIDRSEGITGEPAADGPRL